jgi:PAS domain S-box-containing protein
MTPLRGLNLTVFFFVPTSLITAWLVFQHRLLNLEPIARGVVMEHMEEGVVVVDTNGRIADMNARAGQMLGVKCIQVLGSTPEVFPEPWRDLFATCAPSLSVSTGTAEGRQCWVESSSVELFDPHRTRVGRLYLLRDVTGAVEREAQTKRLIRLEAEQERLREQARLIRDLHDGLGALSANLGMLAVRCTREPAPSAKEGLLRQINQLSCEIGMEVRDIMSSLEFREFYWGDFVHNVRRYAAMVTDAADLTLELTVEGDIPSLGPGYSEGLSLFRCVRESLNNLLKHANARAVEIHFSFCCYCCRF